MNPLPLLRSKVLTIPVILRDKQIPGDAANLLI